MKLCPSQNKALLAPRKGTSQTLDSANIVDSHMVLIVRVEVRHVMLSAGLNEHTNDNSEEPSLETSGITYPIHRPHNARVQRRAERAARGPSAGTRCSSKPLRGS